MTPLGWLGRKTSTQTNLLLTNVCNNSLSVNPFSRLLEVVAKSFKHATAMSTIFRLDVFVCVEIWELLVFTPGYFLYPKNWNLHPLIDQSTLNLYIRNQPFNLGDNGQGLVVQSVVSLTSSLRVISLTVLADSIYNILIFFAEKMWVAFALQKISAYLCITRFKF